MMARSTTKRSALSSEEWIEQILNTAIAAGGKGVALSDLGRPDGESGAAFDAALTALMADRRLIKPAKGRRFFAGEFAPPSSSEAFRASVLERVTEQTAWLEEVLTGRTMHSPEERRVLDALVREGELARIYVVTSPRSKKTAYLRAYEGRPGAKASSPDWHAIESAGRALAADRFDQTVSFEDLARRLEAPPSDVKAAVEKQMALRGGVQLVRGEARESADPSGAGISHDGVTYYRFRFLD